MINHTPLKRVLAIFSVSLLLIGVVPAPVFAGLDELSSRRNGSSFYDPDPISDINCDDPAAEEPVVDDLAPVDPTNEVDFSSCINTGGGGYSDCTNSSGPIDLGDSTDVQAGLWEFLITVGGFSEEQAAGIIGNLHWESGGLNPAAINPSSGATGLAQWVGVRLSSLRQYAAARGTAITEWQTQAEFLLFELTGEAPISTSGVSGGGTESRAYDDLITRTLVDEAAASWALLFERYDDAIDYREIMEANGFNSPSMQIPPPDGFEEHYNYAFNTNPGSAPRPSGFDRLASIGGGPRIGLARAVFEENTGTVAPGGCSGNDDIVVGDTYEGSTCEAGTDASPEGGALGYAEGRPYRIRLCNVQGILVNSEIAVNLDLLLRDARARGIRLGGGGFRDMESQIRLRVAHCPRVSSPDDPDVSRSGISCTPPTAPAGYSNHQMGLAIDFTCNGLGIINKSRRPGTTVCFNWLRDNAARYGLFNLPSENWHWSVDGG